MVVTVTVQRPARPAIWLDTSVLVKIARARSGKTLSDADRTRVDTLVQTIDQGVVERRLVCIESEQIHEMRDDASARKLGGILDALTSGVHLQAELTSRHRQFEHAMQAYLAGSSEIVLPQSTFYKEDPGKEVDAALSRRFMVSVRLPTDPELRRERERAKTETLRNLEATRRRIVESGITFEQQLAAEYGGVLTGYLAVVRRGVEQPLDFWARQGALAGLEAFEIWRALGGKPQQLRDFFESEHLRAIPWVDIQCRVHAALMTQPQPIESGDSADVDHLATALPIADFVLTDRKMEKRLLSLALDSKWGARAYSLHRTKELLTALGQVEPRR